MDENTLLNSDLGQGNNSLWQEIFIVLKENMVQQTLSAVEEEDPSVFHFSVCYSHLDVSVN